ncbi:exodeoxyribonuclease VII small subunit [Neptunomonas phycophila]|jgi:exodeoxyribonuclease VII small subunit|uniref:Exodeoxyribonuclease 7 small subunit n=1 Tax=Neptunomonas phycophila TaxID=1572645 RepID=A0ABT9EX72_9GAMM|nr:MULTISPECIES: exodeoxyribonuclease VII small subunit [Neptunomonas]MDN2660690.1 exodeoxyribonuclease VII small subunit [Neptunomonas sp. CHC150]MDO6468060.1 exodeoxyribonuclease VII small subunit [Neptunomonas phycophila]MDP2523647.1 exodeoxyribonuclease VII small subunit [Neptunomonas phycophila]QLE96543.1 exodeoxyribonuclease VII small subunit [Neptunomonas phycophila]
MPRKKKTPDFEQSLSDLEALVSRMEQGELTLDDSLAAFEDGIRLTRECQSFLDQAEQKVQILSSNDGKLTVAPFDTEQD